MSGRCARLMMMGKYAIQRSGSNRPVKSRVGRSESGSKLRVGQI